ncbi:hypothetical protein AB0J52_07775 [Spirillospora sp. NPDC049652]
MTLTAEQPVARRLRASRPSRLFWLLAAGYVVHVAVRLAMSWGRTTPVYVPDESGYLVAGRWLAGGAGMDLTGQTFYQAGYSLLFAPVYLVVHDPATVYRLVLGINAVVGALAFPLGRALLLRCGMKPREALVLACAAAFLPVATLYSRTVMTDAVLPVLALGWLLALDRFVRDGRAGQGVVASLLAAYMYSMHMRGMVVLAMHWLVLVSLPVLRHTSLGAFTRRWHGTSGQEGEPGRHGEPGWRPAPGRSAMLWALGVAAVGTAAAWTLNTEARTALYPGGPSNLQSIAIDRLTTPTGLLHSVTAGGGELWAMSAGSWGLAAVGLVTALITVRRGRSADRLMTVVLLLTTAGVAVASAAALPNEHRVGNFAYERYVGLVALPYTLIGLASLQRTRRTLAAVVALCGFGGWLVLYLGDRLHTYDFRMGDFPDIALLGGSYSTPHLMTTSVVASVILALLSALLRWGTVRFAITLAVLNVALSVPPLTVWRFGENDVISTPPPPIASGGVVIARHVPGVEHPVPDVVEPIPGIMYSVVAERVWWTHLKRFDPSDGVGPGVCMAVVEWPAGVTAADTWPQHPPAWRFQRSVYRGSLWWVTWYDPSCIGRKDVR